MRWKIPGMTPEDAFQEGIVAAIRAIRRFDPSKHFAVTTFVGTCLEHARIDLFRAFHRSSDAFHSCSLGTEITKMASEDPGYAYFLSAEEAISIPGLTENERSKVESLCLYYTGSVTSRPPAGALFYLRQKAKGS